MTKTEASEMQINAEAIIIHPDYDKDTFTNDIALVRLNEKVNLTKFIRTLCLPETDLAVPGEYGYVAGWGVTIGLKPGERNTKDVSNVLQYSAFPVQENSLCLSKTRYTVNQTVMFCAGDGGGNQDSCKGDSGGPFVRQDIKDGKRRWMAAGLVSWGEGCAMKGRYGYYTRVAPFVDWINHIIQDDKGAL